MSKNELRKNESGSSRKAITIIAVIALALIVVVGIFAAIASSSKSGNKEVVSQDKEAVVQVEESAEKEDVAQAESDASEVAEEAEESEEVVVVDSDDAEELDYAAVFIVTINPKVKIYVDAEGIVVKMEKMNDDAEELLAEIDWANKKLEDCFNALLVKAHEKGYLNNNAKVSIEVSESKDDTVVSEMTEDMETVVEETCKDIKVDITLTLKSDDAEETMEKDIKGTTTTENTILPTDTTQEQANAEDKTEADKPQSGSSSNTGSNSGSSNSGNTGSSGDSGNSGDSDNSGDTGNSGDDGNTGDDDNSGDDGNSGDGGSDDSGNTGDDDNNGDSSDDDPITPPEVQDEYKLVWEDNFDGDELDRSNWNVELHQPGWVNEEWQEYVDSKENIYLKDSNLVIQPIKTTKDGKDYYTSGRVNTQNHQDFKYGKFEAKIKVPSGKGFLPAFWMMPTDEQYYGQWPKCGEIDIMEVMGQSTDTLHGTIHYGEPHGQKQGTYVLDASEADFAETFHVYTCEWEPGKITWYVDGVKYHEATDWYTKREGFDEVAYPAPFDQPFYMILNVAVGGSWVGNPNETTEFGDNAQMQVDYVRVYQKDSYDENVEKPVKEEIQDSAIGENILLNAGFENDESFDDDVAWKFLWAEGGSGNATIADVDGNKVLKIETETAGTVDYSVQLVQGPIALKQGNKYKVSFDAWADEERIMKANVTAPDLNYIRYWGDQTVNLTTEKQTFTYEFDMTKDGDANSRFEMTFGNMGSTATVYIDNIKVEKTSIFELPEEEKTLLPDGNYVYNSGFDTGSDRLKYWTVDSTIAGVEYCATNVNGVREFKAVVPNTVSALDDVVLKQDDIAIVGGKDYIFTFDAYGVEAKTIKAVISPKATSGDVEELVYDINVSTDKNAYEFTFAASENVTGADVKFLIGSAGTTYIDNVRVQEDSNVINGNFANGYAGWVKYALNESEITFAIDEKDNGSGTSAAAITIPKTGNEDWHIQLKQDVALEKGKSYRVSFDAWSTLERKIKFAIQEDQGAWTEYSGGQYPTVKPGGFETFSYEFTMTSETDEKALLTFTLGAVNKEEINTPHTVFIDNVTLEEIDEVSTEGESKNMLTNPNFDSMEGWITTWDTQWDANNPNYIATASSKVENNKLIYDITNVGNFDYSIQLKQEGLDFEEDAKYRVSFDVSSTVARDIKFALMGAKDAYYGGNDKIPVTTEVNTVSFDFVPKEGMDSYDNLAFQLSLGKVGDNVPTSTLTFANMKLVKLETQQPEQTKPVNVTLSDINLVKTKDKDGKEVTNVSNMATGKWEGCTVEDGKLKITVNNPGTNPWDVQVQMLDMNLEADCEYKLTFKGSADAEKLIQIGLQEHGDDYTVYSLIEGQNIAVKLGTTEKSYTIVFKMNATGDKNAKIFISLGNVTTSNAGYILSADEEEPGEGGETPSTPEVVEGNMVEHGDFTLSDAFDEGKMWELWAGYPGENTGAVADVKLSGGNAKFDISNLGSNAWDIQLEYKKPIKLEKGHTYKVKYDALSTESRKIKAQFGNAASEIYIGEEVDLVKDELKNVEYEFIFESETNDAMTFVFQLGKFDDTTPTSIVTIDNISIVEVSKDAGEGTPDDDGETPSTPELPADSMFERGGFSAEDTAYVEGGTNIWDVWSAYAADSSASLNGETAYGNGCMTVSIADEGDVAWGIQLMYKPMVTLEKDAQYILTFDATSSVSRGIVSQFQNSGNNVGWNPSALIAGETKHVTFPFTYGGEDNADYNFCINMGKMDGADAIGEAHTITFDNFSLVKVSSAPEAALTSLDEALEEAQGEEFVDETTDEGTSDETTDETSEDTTSEDVADEETEEDEDTTDETVEEEAIIDTKSEEEDEVVEE